MQRISHWVNNKVVAGTSGNVARYTTQPREKYKPKLTWHQLPKLMQLLQ